MIPIPVALSAHAVNILLKVGAALLLLLAIWWAAVLPRQRLSAEREAHAQTKATFERVRADAESRARERERAMAQTIEKAKGEADAALKEVRRRRDEMAAMRVSADGLREQLVAYAGGRPDDPTAACTDRAGRLGDALGECASLLSEGAALLRAAAGDADERAVKLQACISGWPR